MATAPADAGADLVPLRRLPTAALRELLEHERAAWRDRLAWDTPDAVDLGVRALSAGVLQGAALRWGHRLDGFLAWQLGRPVSRVVGGWLAPQATPLGIRCLVDALLADVPKPARLEGQVLAFDRQADLDGAMALAGCTVEPRQYLIASVATAPAPESPAGSRLELLQPEHVADCARALVAAHRGGVEARINLAFRSERLAHEYLTDILAGQGCGQVVPEACVVARGGGGVTGFCLGTLIASGVGHVPQVVVDPAAQGTGQGKAVLGATMTAMRWRGVARVTLSVSCANRRAASWYERLGFRPASAFSAYHRDARIPGYP